MKFTEEDIPLMKLIFNPETHDMGMLIGRERAEEIFVYVCNKIRCSKEDFIQYPSDFFERILRTENFCDFFWDNNIIPLSSLNQVDISYMLRDSPIREKIWDSERLYLNKLDDGDTFWILENSSIAKKIWDSGKLNLSLLDKRDLEYFKQKFESQCISRKKTFH